MRILVTDGMDKTAMAQLREMGHEVVEQFYEPDQLGAALRDFDAVVVRSKTKVRANHIDEAKGGKLKLIIRGGVGVDNIDVKYAEANGITVKNTPKASSQSVAELAMGHMFSCARYISIAGHTMREDGTNVDEAALLAALESGKVRAAGLDVYADEPASNKALYSHPMVSCTPHIGAATNEAQERIGVEIVDIIKNF